MNPARPSDPLRANRAIFTKISLNLNGTSMSNHVVDKFIIIFFKSRLVNCTSPERSLMDCRRPPVEFPPTKLSSLTLLRKDRCDTQWAQFIPRISIGYPHGHIKISVMDILWTVLWIFLAQSLDIFQFDWISSEMNKIKAQF